VPQLHDHADLVVDRLRIEDLVLPQDRRERTLGARH
jgi:hypothetical protein